MGRTAYILIGGILLLAVGFWLTRAPAPPSAPVAEAPPPTRREGTGAKLLARQDQPPSLWTDAQKEKVKSHLEDVANKRRALREQVATAEKTAGVEENGGWKRDLAGQDLQGAEMMGEDLSHANLAGANLQSAKLAGADLSDSNVTGVDGKGANLSDSRLVNTDFSHSDLRGARFAGAYIEGVFEKADLRGTDMRGSGIIETNMREADLRNAFFDMASVNADLTGADLRGAVFRYADVYGSNFAGADVDGADFTEVNNLTCEQLTSAKNWQSAKVNPDFRCEAPPQ